LPYTNAKSPAHASQAHAGPEMFLMQILPQVDHSATKNTIELPIAAESLIAAAAPQWLLDHISADTQSPQHMTDTTAPAAGAAATAPCIN
jgi:hypothetical protein